MNWRLWAALALSSVMGTAVHRPRGLDTPAIVPIQPKSPVVFEALGWHGSCLIEL